MRWLEVGTVGCARGDRALCGGGSMDQLRWSDRDVDRGYGLIRNHVHIG